jgi:hypothetical protein
MSDRLERKLRWSVASRALTSPRAPVAERFNRDSFGFGHNLHEFGLFRFERLLELGAGYAQHPHDFFVSAAAASAGTGFNSVRHSYCSVEALQRLDQEPTRVLLKRPENHDSQFRELLHAHGPE